MNFQEYSESPYSFGRTGRVLSPGPAVLNVKAVICLEAGNITIIPLDGGEELPFIDVPAGFMPPFHVRSVPYASGAFATVE